MLLKKLLVAAVIPFSLLGCPDKAADAKPDPATAAKDASAAVPAATGAAPAASAKSGGW